VYKLPYELSELVVFAKVQGVTAIMRDAHSALHCSCLQPALLQGANSFRDEFEHHVSHLGEGKGEAEVEGGHSCTHAGADYARAHADYELAPKHVHHMMDTPECCKGDLHASHL